MDIVFKMNYSYIWIFFFHQKHVLFKTYLRLNNVRLVSVVCLGAFICILPENLLIKVHNKAWQCAVLHLSQIYLPLMTITY